MKNKDILFFILTIFHILVWVFVLFAFLNIKTAKFNLYILIPLIYILHCFPFHFINKIKESLYKNDWEERVKKIENSIFFVYYYHKLLKHLDKNCFLNPISPQGMLIFGLISCSYRLYFFNK